MADSGLGWSALHDDECVVVYKHERRRYRAGQGLKHCCSSFLARDERKATATLFACVRKRTKADLIVLELEVKSFSVLFIVKSVKLE